MEQADAGLNTECVLQRLHLVASGGRMAGLSVRRCSLAGCECNADCRPHSAHPLGRQDFRLPAHGHSGAGGRVTGNLVGLGLYVSVNCTEYCIAFSAGISLK